MGGRLRGSLRRADPAPLRRGSGRRGRAPRTAPSTGRPGAASSPAAAFPPAAAGSPASAPPEPSRDLPVAGPGLDRLRRSQPHLLAADPFCGGQPAAIGVPHGSGIAQVRRRHQSQYPPLKISVPACAPAPAKPAQPALRPATPSRQPRTPLGNKDNKTIRSARRGAPVSTCGGAQNGIFCAPRRPGCLSRPPRIFGVSRGAGPGIGSQLVTSADLRQCASIRRSGRLVPGR